MHTARLSTICVVAATRYLPLDIPTHSGHTHPWIYLPLWTYPSLPWTYPPPHGHTCPSSLDMPFPWTYPLPLDIPIPLTIPISQTTWYQAYPPYIRDLVPGISTPWKGPATRDTHPQKGHGTRDIHILCGHTQTHTCENISFPQFRWRVAIISNGKICGKLFQV